VTNAPDDRSPLAEGIAWASRVTTIALEMVIPGVIGLWVDDKLGTMEVFPVFLVLGVILGLTTGIFHLARLGKSTQRGDRSDQNS
jgi:F0F1-type ATP synthase assembly protein I